MKTQSLPVLVSIVVIILVAILEKQSKLVAAITATMPTTAPLALWIVYSANKGDQGTMESFGLGMLLAVVPSIGFLVASWLAFRGGLKLVPVLLIGYAVWGVGVGLLLVIRKMVGV